MLYGGIAYRYMFFLRLVPSEGPSAPFLPPGVRRIRSYVCAGDVPAASGIRSYVCARGWFVARMSVPAASRPSMSVCRRAKQHWYACQRCIPGSGAHAWPKPLPEAGRAQDARAGICLASNTELRRQRYAYVLDMSRGKNRSTSQSNPTRTFFSVVGSIER